MSLQARIAARLSIHKQGKTGKVIYLEGRAREQCQWKIWSQAEESRMVEGCICTGDCPGWPSRSYWGPWLQPSLHLWARPAWEKRLAVFIAFLWQTYSCIFREVYSWHPKLLGKHLHFLFSSFDVPSPEGQFNFIPWIIFPCPWWL